MKPNEFSVLGPLMGGFGSQAFLGCLHVEGGTIKPAVMVFLADEIVDSPDLFRKVWAETELGSQIDHVNVIAVMGVAKLDEGFARVVEYADAESLRSVYRRATTLKQVIPPSVACSIVADACMGAHYAHELGMMESGEALIHGGIRPETLQVSFQGMTKVTGYGATTIAEVMRKSRGGDSKDAYTAPEQSYGGRAAATVQTDVYALGCVLYEALTGKAPFAADNDLAEAMIKDELTKRVSDDTGVTEQMAQIVLRATRKKSAERFATALEMRHALKETCVVADEKVIRRFMDELYPPETVPRATRDQMLIAAREKPPAPTGRLLSEIPPELSKAVKARASVPSDADVEAAQGVRVEGAAPPSVSAAPTLVPTPLSGVPAPVEPEPEFVEAEPVPPPPTAEPTAIVRTRDVSRTGKQRAVRPSATTPPSWQANPTAPPQPGGYATQPPVVYRTPPGLLVGLGLAAGVAVALVVVLVMKDGEEKPAPVVVQAPPPAPPPQPTPPTPPPTDPAPTNVQTPTPTPTGNRNRSRDDMDDPPEKAPPPKPAATGPATLTISAEPPSMTISVDGKVLGKGQATWTGTAGKKTIVGKDPAQGISVMKSVTVKPGASLDVELEAKKGRLAFDQLPDGVDVYVDGKHLGKTPLPSAEFWAGPHKLKVVKGSAAVPYSINLPAGREMYITATFGG